MPFSRYIDSAKRHIDKFIMGMEDEDHLSAAVWNLMCIVHHQELGQIEHDDLPHYLSETNEEKTAVSLTAIDATDSQTFYMCDAGCQFATRMPPKFCPVCGKLILGIN